MEEDQRPEEYDSHAHILRLNHSACAADAPQGAPKPPPYPPPTSAPAETPGFTLPHALTRARACPCRIPLLAAEMQAIGSVMLVYKTDEATQLAFRVPLGIDEFLRIVSAEAPDMDAPYQLQYDWMQSFDNKLQVRRPQGESTIGCSPLTTR